MNQVFHKLYWRLRGSIAKLNFLLLLALLFCGLSIVKVTDKRRHLFIQLERATLEQHRLAQEWSRLQYEQSVLSKVARIERIAIENLNMRPATPERTIYLDAKTFKPVEELQKFFR